MPGLRSGLYFIVGIAALTAGCGGAVDDGLVGNGTLGQGGSGGAGASNGSSDGGDDGISTGGEDGGNAGTAGSGSGGSGIAGSGGSGNTAGTGSGGGNTGNCDVSTCESVNVFGVMELPGCCPDNGGGCGLDVSAAEQYAGVTGCIELDQEGNIDDGCPTESRPGQQGLPPMDFPGCCRPNNSCGYWVDMSQYSIPSFGCVDPSAVGGPPGGIPCNY